MTPTPRLSIVTINYNDAEGLARTLASLQPWRDSSLIEYVLVDGASTDASLAVAQGFYRPDEMRSEADGGIYDAMNRGLARSTGTFVWWLNAGDTLDADCDLEALLTDALTDDTDPEAPDVLCCGVHVEAADGAWLRTVTPDATVLPASTVPHQGVFFRRSAVVEAGGYDLRYRYAADRDLLVRLLQARRRFVYAGQVVARFRRGGASSTYAALAEHSLVDDVHRIGSPWRRAYMRLRRRTNPWLHRVLGRGVFDS